MENYQGRPLSPETGLPVLIAAPLPLHCVRCTKKGRQTEASVLCEQCGRRPYCAACWEHHVDDDFGDHTSLSATNSANKISPLKCAVHPTQDISDFCVKDQCLVCSLCLATVHNNHKFSDIETAFQQQGQTYVTVMSKCPTWMAAFASAIPAIEQLRAEVDANREHVLRQIRGQFAQYQADLERSRDILLADAEQRSQVKISGLSYQSCAIQARLSTLQEWERDIKQHIKSKDITRALQTFLYLAKSLGNFEGATAPDLKPLFSNDVVFDSPTHVWSHVQSILTTCVFNKNASASNSLIHDAPRHLVFGKEHSFTIIAKREDGSECKMGGAHFRAYIEGQPSAVVHVRDKEDGTYLATFSVEHTESELSLAVLLCGEHIQGSPCRPFQLANASQCTVSGELLTNPRTDISSQLTVTLHDVVGAPLTEGGDTVEVLVSGTPDVPLDVVDNDDGTYTATHTPTTVGEMQLKVSVNGCSLLRSPFVVRVEVGLAIANGPSRILDTDQALIGKLAKMLPANRRNLTKLLDSEQGTDRYVFDNAVRGKGRILTLIRATTGHVFGGFVEDTMCSGQGWVPGSELNFLLRITGEPVKLVRTSGHGVTLGGCGLHMGDSNDLVAFCSHSCNVVNYKTAAPGYTLPNPLNNTTLAGAQSWTPDVMEVFQCNE